MGNTNQQIYGLSINNPAQAVPAAFYTVPGIAANPIPEEGDAVVIGALIHVNGGCANPDISDGFPFPVCTFYEQALDGEAITGFSMSTVHNTDGNGENRFSIDVRVGDGVNEQVLKCPFPDFSTGSMGRWIVVHLVLNPAGFSDRLTSLYVNGVLVDYNDQRWSLPKTDGLLLNGGATTSINPLIGALEVPCRNDLLTLASVGYYVAAARPEGSQQDDGLIVDPEVLGYVIAQSASATIAQRSLMAVGENRPFGASLDPSVIPPIETMPAFQGLWNLRTTNPVASQQFENTGSDASLGPADFLTGVAISPEARQNILAGTVQRDVYDCGFVAGRIVPVSLTR